MFKNRPTKNFKSFLTDNSGVASIEFVLTFPLLIMLFFACIEIYGHFHAVRKLSNVTASIADIVAQTRSISEDQLNALSPLTSILMAPLDATQIKYTITNVRQADADDDPTVVWEHAQPVGSTPGETTLGGPSSNGNGSCQDYDNAAGKTFPPNQDVIFVKVTYTYESIFSSYISGPTEYNDTMLAVPRASRSVKITDKNHCT